MRLRIGPDGPLGVILLLVGAPVLGGLGYLFWADEVDFFRDPSADPLMLLWHEGLAAKLVLFGLASLCWFVMRKRGASPTSDEADSEKRYSDRDDF